MLPADTQYSRRSLSSRRASISNGTLSSWLTHWQKSLFVILASATDFQSGGLLSPRTNPDTMTRKSGLALTRQILVTPTTVSWLLPITQHCSHGEPTTASY